jgi:uncharacterized membrane protein YfcA
MAKNSNASTTAGLAGGFLSSGAGAGVMCPPGDTSLTCKLSRGVTSIKNIIFIVLFIWLAYYMFRNRKNIFKMA